MRENTDGPGTHVGDAAVIGGVAVLLLALHFLVPPAVRTRLAFDYVAFEPLTLVTSAYVHATDAHLFGNLLGYAIGAVYAYGLCVRRGRRTWFRRTAVLLLFALPALVNLVSYAALTLQFPDAKPVSRGFSGVVGGFCGFLLVALFAAVRDRNGVRSAAGSLLVVGFVAVGTLALSRQPNDVVTVVLSLVGVVAAVVGGGLVPLRNPLAGTWERRHLVVEVLLVALAVALLARSLFPVDPIGGPLAGQNVFAHAAGVVFGAVIAGITARISG